MARFQRLIVFLLFFCSVLGVSSGAWAANTSSISQTQGAAFSACQANMSGVGGTGWTVHCKIDPSYSGTTTQGATGTCSSNLASAGGYQVWGYYTGQQDHFLQSNFYWCVPATCSAHDSGDSSQQWDGVYQNGILYCNDGCMSIFHFQTGIGSLEFTNGDGSSWGHFVGNGNRCVSSIDASLFKSTSPAPPICDHGSLSCYNPQRGFCATSEFGEQYCEQPPPSGSGACAVGATGATCVGNNTQPPAPPDPPISKGAPPSSSGSATASNSDGTTNNYITNNYSGTSPGGGSLPSGSSSGGTGSQSNSGGSGNSPGPSGSSGSDSTGKCADGSVPTASGCSGTATDAGCDTPPQCFGDAVMCGQFKEEVAIRCATQKAAAASASSSGSVGDPAAALASAGVPADGGASGDPSASSVWSDDGSGTAVDDSGFGWSRSCPANPTFIFWGVEHSIDISPFCTMAGKLSWFIVLLASVLAVRIVSGGTT